LTGHGFCGGVTGVLKLHKSKIYTNSLALARMGDYDRASLLMQEYLKMDPRNGEAWNDLGVMHFNLGRTEGAINCFERAIEESFSTGQAHLNLAEVYFSCGCVGRILKLFAGMKETGVLDFDIVKRAVQFCIEKGDMVGAMEAAIAGAELMSNNGKIHNLVEQVKSERPKIAIFCGGDGMTFLRNIYDYISKRFEVCVFEGTTIQQVQELMEWSDISWFEWCTNLAEIGSKMPNLCKNVVRLHRYEAYLDWPSRIKWDNIDMLITVGNSFVNEALQKQVPDIFERVEMVKIPNGVDLEKVKYAKRRRGKNLAFVGNLRMVKNPMFILQCMHALKKIDKSYKLFFAGRSQDAVVEQYMRHMVNELDLRDTVFFEGWQEDIQSWLSDKQYIVASSVIESQGMGILEGMACGLKPIVHSFPGSREIFGEDFLFGTSEEFCTQILSEDYRPERYRAFVEQHYSLPAQLARVNEVFGILEEKLRGMNKAEEGAFCNSEVGAV
jgi:hypothetical protein